MTSHCRMLFFAVTWISFALVSGSVRAEATVSVTKVHICCKGCVSAIEEAVAKAAEDKEHPAQVKCAVDADTGAVELTGADVAAIQSAVDQIAAAGFHGKLDNKEVKWPKAELPKGKVTRLEVTGVHNCCGACAKAIKAALAEVEGVAGDSVKPKEESFVIEGDFEPKAAFKALHKAGFHASLPEKK
jgi:periplasmic mercuric ion binding protein